MEAEGSEAAGSVAAAAPSETSAESSGPQPGPAAEESMQQGGGSVNWGQATAQSPRVPRSQISRAHPAHAAAGFGERTSAVLSALSGDDETALSAAEAAGEHTSEPQEPVAGVGETVVGVPVPAALLQAQLHQQPALSLTAPVPRTRGGFELASSPPASASPMYRANSVVSHTAGAALGGGRMQQPGVRRGAETPASAPAVPPPGSSPPNSRGEFSGAVPQLRVPRRGAFSAGLPPASGQRAGQQQPLGPSRPSLSAGQSQAAGLSLPSTMAVALGALSPPGAGALWGQLTPQAAQPPGSAGMASLLPLAASMGVPAAQLGNMAAALMQAQTSVLGAQQTQQAQQSQQGQGQAGALEQAQQHLPPPPHHKPAAQQAQQAQQQQTQTQTPQQAAAGQSMPPPAPLQALQQAEALQGVAAMLQAQASAIIGSGPSLLPAEQQEGGQQQQQQQQQQPGPGQGGSGGANSVQSLPSLVGASAIQGHPLPPPFHAAAATTPAPLQSYGGGTHAPAGGAAPPTVHSGPFLAPGPLAVPAGTPLLHPTATAVSEIRGSPAEPTAGLQHQQQQQQHAEAAAAAPAAAEQQPDLAAPLQQAGSAVQGSGNHGGSPRRPLVSPSPDPEQQAAEEERRRHEGDPPQPQAAVIVELPTADVAAASQGGGLPGGHLPFAEPQEAAMLGGNSTFADAMELGADEDDAMEVQQEPAPTVGGAGELPPAPHGAASVMATLMTDNGEAQSEGDAEMEQQAASGPSRSAAAAQPERSLSRSMAEPAAATAHNTGARSALTGPPSQQGPATSHGRAAHALSSLATVSTGNGEGLGGSVEMSALPSQQAAQHATSAPAAFAPPEAPLPAPPLADAVGDAALAAHAAAAAAAAQAGAHAAVSAPAAVPPQQPFVAAPALGAAAVQAAPAASVSMSGQGDTPGGQVFGTGVVAMPQSSVAAVQQAAGGALQEGQGDMAPLTDARSRQQGVPPAAPAPALATIEGLGSPAVSMHVAGAQPQESRGTARGTILAGAAHSILTTAAAGEGEAMDEGGEALSPLVAAKAQAQMAAAQAGAAAGAAATPGSGSVGGTPGVLPGSASAPPGAAAASSERAGPSGAQNTQPHQRQAVAHGQASAGKGPTGAGSGQRTANGYAAHDGPSAAAGAAALASQGVGSPIDYSTMAVDLAPAGPADAPQPSASFQPSSLPPPGAAAAALAALEAAQAAQNGSLWQTPPPAAAEQLGEAIQAMARQNGYAAHATSAIGNGHVATSPDRELTSPSRLLTHDSTGSGPRQQAAKRRRTSVGPADSTPHA